MKIVSKSVVVCALALSMIITASGCRGGQDSASKAAVLHVAQGKSVSDRVNFPWYTVGQFDTAILFRPLVIADGTLRKVNPALASKWQASEDGKTYSFELRDTKWDDGNPVTGEDVAWSFATVLQAARVAGIYTNEFKKIVGASEVIDGSAKTLSGVKVADNKITIELTKPSADFLPVVAQFVILPKHKLEKVNPLTIDKDPFWQDPVGCGPYKLKVLNAGNFVEFEANADYYDGKPKIAEVVVQGSTDPVSDAQSGRIDYFNTNDVSLVNRMKDITSFNKFEAKSLFYRYFVVNIKDNPRMSDPLVRAGLMYAIDREALAKSVYKGEAKPLSNGVPDDNDMHWDGAEKFTHNKDKAIELLRQANYDFTEPLRLRFYYNDEVSRTFMTAVSQQLQDLGLAVELLKFQGDATTELFESRKYDIALKGFSSMAIDDWYSEYLSKNFAQIYGELPQLQELYNALSEAKNDDEKKAAAIKLQEWEQNNLYKIPMFTIPNSIFVANKVKTPEQIWGNPFYLFDNKIQQWTIES